MDVAKFSQMNSGLASWLMGASGFQGPGVCK